MRIAGTHHVAILTPDLDRLRAFYIELLELPVIGGFSEHHILFIAAGNIVVELEEQAGEEGHPRSSGGGGWHHLALEVDDVDAAHAELSARGVPFHVPPTDFPEGAPGGPVMRIAFFTDPDGNTLELVQSYRTAPRWRHTDASRFQATHRGDTIEAPVIAVDSGEAGAPHMLDRQAILEDEVRPCDHS